jgi:hypothetical protein
VLLQAAWHTIWAVELNVLNGSQPVHVLASYRIVREACVGVACHMSGKGFTEPGSVGCICIATDIIHQIV